MKKISELKNKFILIEITYSGFGNKIFDSIIGIYIKYKFGYSIYYVDRISTHNKPNEPQMLDIFINLKNEFIIISEEEGAYINHILNYEKLCLKVNNLNELLNKFVNDMIILKSTNIYNLVFDMYHSFNNKLRDIFIINQNLIDNNILSYSKTKYATIHIRYGDKLKFGINNNKTLSFILFPIYTPEFYYKQILKIKILKLPIIILSDSINVVKHFILEKYNLINDPDIFILDISYINSFYLLLFSSYSVMSHSTFSYSAYLLSKHISLNKKVYIFCLTNEFYNKYKVLDLFTSPEWTFIYNKKYILNFNQKLITKMYYYNKKYHKIISNQ